MYGWKIDGVLLGIEQLGATATFKNGNLYIVLLLILKYSLK